MKFFHESHGCSLAVDIVARELGIPLEIVWVDMQRKVLPDGTDLHAINPKGQVPSLQLPDGQFLSEGLAIMQYLADQRPDSDLATTARGVEKYRVLEWMSFVGSDLHKGGFMPLFKKTTPDDYRPLARQLVVSRMKLLDEHLADRKYLTGATFTIADAHCYAIAMWTHYHDIDLAPWPNLSAYLERIARRPSVQAAKAAERAEAQRQGYEGKV